MGPASRCADRPRPHRPECLEPTEFVGIAGSGDGVAWSTLPIPGAIASAFES